MRHFLLTLALTALSIPALAQYRDSPVNFDDPTLVIQPVTDCDKADLIKAETAAAAANKELLVIKSRISHNYESRSGEPCKSAIVEGHYVFITTQNGCVSWGNSIGGFVYVRSNN